MLFMIAMDYLPIQATSVPCKQVFSSAKETDTNKRNRMSPMLMEALQILKLSLKKERLDCMEGWATLDAALCGGPWLTKDLLGTLFTGNCENVMDKILKTLSTYDD